jgi:hypothetical protein
MIRKQTVNMTGKKRKRHSQGVITLRPSALLEISLILETITVRLIKLYIIIFDRGRLYSQVRFPVIQELIEYSKKN